MRSPIVPLLGIALALSAASVIAQERESARDDRERESFRAVLVDENGDAQVVETPHGPYLHRDGRRHDDRLRFLDWGRARGYLGVQLLDLTPELREHFGVDEDRGVLVAKVLEDSPAATAGVEVGDILLSVDGEAIEHVRDLSIRVAGKEEGEEVELEVWHDGRIQDTRVAVEQREGRLVDLTPGVWLRPPGANLDDKAHILQLRGERLEDLDATLEHLKEYFGSEAWEKRVHHLEDTDWESVDERMKRVEERLRELEAALDKGSRSDEATSPK